MMAWLSPHPDSLFGRLPSLPYLRWQAGMQTFWLIVLIQWPLIWHPFSWHWMAPTLLSMPFYLFFYTRIFIGPARWINACIACIAALGYLLELFNPAGFIYVVCAGIALGLSASWVRWLGGVAVMSLLLVPYVVFLDANPIILWIAVAGGTAGGFKNFLYMINLRRDAELRLSQGDVRRLAVIAERERIGRDLHDLLGHTLSLVALKSELARRLAIVEPERAQREMEEVERVARHALAEVRAAVSGMRCSDLAGELVSARLMLEASGVSFDGEWPAGIDLPPYIEAPLALILREAITNIHRHARAGAASVRFARDGDKLCMTIVDNGRGGLVAHGNGVSGMRERVRAFGGELRIDSPPHRGTTLHVTVPATAIGEVSSSTHTQRTYA